MCVLTISPTPVVLLSESIAGNRVFQLVCWTNTFNTYLSMEELEGLIDENPEEDVVLEHTAAGSNTEKNASVLTDVRMGAGKTGGTCASCRAAGVGLEFLATKKHSRRGASKCDQIRKEWAAAN